MEIQHFAETEYTPFKLSVISDKNRQHGWNHLNIIYHNDSKYLDRQAWANSVDLKEQSDPGLHCLPFDSFRYILRYNSYLVQILEKKSNNVWCPNFYDFYSDKMKTLHTDII